MKKIIYLLLYLIPAFSYAQESTGGIQIQTNFGVNIAAPIDSRTVLASVADTANIAYKYASLKVYCLDIARYFTYNGTAWIQETANGSALPNNIADTALVEQKILGNVIYDSQTNVSYIWNGTEWITVTEFTENAFPLTTLADTSIFQAPVTGQVVYDMSTGQYWYYNGSNWTYLNYVQDATTIATLADTTTIIGPVLGDAVFVTATGEYWIFNGTNWEILSQFISGATPLPSIADTTIFAAPVVGQAVYDQQTMQFYIWNGTNWELVNLDNPQSQGFSVPFFIIPGPFITASGGDAAAPSDSIINNIGQILYNAGALTAGAYMGTRGPAASANPMYSGFSPYNTWQWTGSAAYKLSGKPVAISLTDTLWGGSAVRPLDTVIYSGAYPTPTEVATWYLDNYEANGLYLENGSIAYFVGSGTKENPDHVYYIAGSDLTRNDLEQQLVKEIGGAGNWLKPIMESGNDVDIATERSLFFNNPGANDYTQLSAFGFYGGNDAGGEFGFDSNSIYADIDGSGEDGFLLTRENLIGYKFAGLSRFGMDSSRISNSISSQTIGQLIHSIDFQVATSSTALINIYATENSPNFGNEMIFQTNPSGIASPQDRMKIGSDGDVTLYNSAIILNTIWLDEAKTIGIFTGSGSPEGVQVASPGSRWYNTAGGAGTTFYVKESGTGNTGWVGK